MVALLEHSPDLYLDEIQEQLGDMHGIDVSLATVSRTLKRLGYSNKRVTFGIFSAPTCSIHLFQLSKAAAERSEEARRQFRMEIGAEAPECIVCADESAVNILTTYRLNGWAYRGIRARKRCKFVRGTRYVVVALLRLCLTDFIAGIHFYLQSRSMG
jgi:hypothetical protein